MGNKWTNKTGDLSGLGGFIVNFIWQEFLRFGFNGIQGNKSFPKMSDKQQIVSGHPPYASPSSKFLALSHNHQAEVHVQWVSGSPQTPVFGSDWVTGPPLGQSCCWGGQCHVPSRVRWLTALAGGKFPEEGVLLSEKDRQYKDRQKQSVSTLDSNSVCVCGWVCVCVGVPVFCPVSSTHGAYLVHSRHSMSGH